MDCRDLLQLELTKGKDGGEMGKEYLVEQCSRSRADFVVAFSVFYSRDFDVIG